MLQGCGFKVGLQISPHLIDLRERFQINTQLISEELFIKTLKKIIPTIEKAKETTWGKITYFEIIVGFTFYFFWKQKVDFAVMETGLGGLYDGTNVVDNPNKLVILTRIGLDHQWILGKTYEKIAGQKAGIIKKNNTAVTLKQKKSVERVFETIVKNQQASLYQLQQGKNFKNVFLSKQKTIFDFHFDRMVIKKIQLGLIGGYQVENCSLALAGLWLLAKKNHFKVNLSKIRTVLKTVSFHGRFQILKTKKQDIVVDGAHNPQKMKAFITALKKIYPGQKFNFLISFSRSKDQIPTMRSILKHIIPLSDKIFLTSFTNVSNDSLHKSVSLEKIITILKEFDFKNYQTVVNNRQIIKRVIRESDSTLVITGSLYLISSIYKYLLKTMIR